MLAWAYVVESKKKANDVYEEIQNLEAASEQTDGEIGKLNEQLKDANQELEKKNVELNANRSKISEMETVIYQLNEKLKEHTRNQNRWRTSKKSLDDENENCKRKNGKSKTSFA